MDAERVGCISKIFVTVISVEENRTKRIEECPSGCELPRECSSG